MTPRFSQIVRLTKSLLLNPGTASKRPSAQFFAGKHSAYGSPSGIGVSWWYSDDTFQALDAVVALTLKNSPDFRDCDPDTVSEVVIKTLQEVCVDQAIFDVDAVVFPRGQRHQTLFDCRVAPVPQYAAAILKAIETNLRALICRRCTIYAVPRFQVTSFSLAEDSIHVIAKRDRDAWQTLIEEGYQFDGWTPEHTRVGTREDRIFAPPGDFECVLVAEEHGTQEGSRFSSVLKFRKLTAVLFAIASQRAAYPYHKATARPLEFCMQFPHRSSADATITRSDCDPLISFFASDIPIGADEVAATRDWYNRCSRCSPDAKSRVEKGAHFLNRGMNSDDIEAYVNYFVTLDALFGQRGSVEASILAGVHALGIDSSYAEKTSWLFDLRNEIVHGGSRYITEWPKYNKYTQHFRTKPLSDVQVLAQLAVLRAPHVLAR